MSEDTNKQLGMFLAASNNTEILRHFQTLAIELGRNGRIVTIDDVRAYADRIGVVYAPGNWLGSVFSVKGWQWTGRMMPSTHKGSHSRMVKVWEWRPIQ